MTWAAIEDAGLDPQRISCAYVGSSLAGLLTGQEGVRGQVVLQEAGLDQLPVVNVENACASATTALRGAWLEVGAGTCDVALALGVEKMHVGDTSRSLAALATDSELELELAQMGMQFTATYAAHPKYDLREEVLAAPMIADPLTLLMCWSIGDGAAAAIVCAREVADELAAKQPVEIEACMLRLAIRWAPPGSGRSPSSSAGVGRLIDLWERRQMSDYPPYV